VLIRTTDAAKIVAFANDEKEKKRRNGLLLQKQPLISYSCSAPITSSKVCYAWRFDDFPFGPISDLDVLERVAHSP
jgi:hypothetical protein